MNQAPAPIEFRDGTDIRRIRLPQIQTLFAQRAERLRQLVADSAIADYIGLMAVLVDAQHQCVQKMQTELSAGMQKLPLIAPSAKLDPLWHQVLFCILECLEQQSNLLPSVVQVIKDLRNASADELDTQAQAILAQYPRVIANAPFIAAALQVVYASKAAQLSEQSVPYADPASACPACGGAPVVSVVRLGEQNQNYRYLHCGVCETEWHMVRVKCTHCGSTNGIAYEHIENGPEYIQAETCTECHTYSKVIDQEKNAQTEPLADDLGSFALDLLMSQTEFARTSFNPLLPFAAIEGHAE